MSSTSTYCASSFAFRAEVSDAGVTPAVWATWAAWTSVSAALIVLPIPRAANGLILLILLLLLLLTIENKAISGLLFVVRERDACVNERAGDDDDGDDDNVVVDMAGERDVATRRRVRDWTW